MTCMSTLRSPALPTVRGSDGLLKLPCAAGKDVLSQHCQHVISV
jgi:hypothetical protein